MFHSYIERNQGGLAGHPPGQGDPRAAGQQTRALTSKLVSPVTILSSIFIFFYFYFFFLSLSRFFLPIFFLLVFFTPVNSSVCSDPCHFFPCHSVTSSLLQAAALLEPGERLAPPSSFSDQAAGPSQLLQANCSSLGPQATRGSSPYGERPVSRSSVQQGEEPAGRSSSHLDCKNLVRDGCLV